MFAFPMKLTDASLHWIKQGLVFALEDYEEYFGKSAKSFMPYCFYNCIYSFFAYVVWLKKLPTKSVFSSGQLQDLLTKKVQKLNAKIKNYREIFRISKASPSQGRDGHQEVPTKACSQTMTVKCFPWKKAAAPPMISNLRISVSVLLLECFTK